jgi:hypothetical protein
VERALPCWYTTLEVAIAMYGFDFLQAGIFWGAQISLIYSPSPEKSFCVCRSSPWEVNNKVSSLWVDNSMVELTSKLDCLTGTNTIKR